MPLRLVFMGTPEFAVPTLAALDRQGHAIPAVYTRAPAPAGRGMAFRPSPVQQRAEELGLPVLTPASLKGDAGAAQLAAFGPDVVVVVAYGLILPQAILDVPRLGCLNLHGSLLPRWRGAAPMQRALMAGDAETGVMVMRMEAGLDTGPVALTDRLRISPEMTAGKLHDELATRGADLMVRALDSLEVGSLRFTPQPEAGVIYARKIEKAECRIRWDQPSRAVHDHVRGLSPFPGAFFEADLGRGRERIKVLQSRVAGGTAQPGTVLEAGDGRLTIACADHAVGLLRIQRAGKPPIDVTAFLNGTAMPAGMVLPLDGA